MRAASDAPILRELARGGAPEGYMSVFFDVAQPFNFSNYQYWIVFNTSGNGLTPGTQPFLNNWAAYSEAIEVAGNGGSAFARAVQFVKNPSNPHIPPAFLTLYTTPQQLQFNVNSNGSGTEFNVIFQRSIFLGPLASPAPLAANWLFNGFTTQASVQNNLVFVDSMGAGGPKHAAVQLARIAHLPMLRSNVVLVGERAADRPAGLDR